MSSQQQSQQSSRPGRMTAVMRAVPQQQGPKILRIGVVQGGKVTDERLIKQRGSVTIGPSERAMFVVASRRIPPNFKLFEEIGSDYYLQFLDGMKGRVALAGGISQLDKLRGQAKRVTVAGGVSAYRVRLNERSRGKVVVGETTFLFQFVAPPPVQPRPQLPVSVQRGMGGDIDWFTTIVAAFSFLLHFFFVALVYSDWMDQVVDDDVAVTQLVESVRSLPPPPALEKPQADVDSDATANATAEAATPKATKKVASKGAGKGGKGAAGKGTGKAGQAEGDAKSAEIASQLAALEVETLAALGSGGPATGNVLTGDSDVPAGLLNEAGRSAMGTGSGDPGGLGLGSGSGSGSVTPGAGGGGKLSSIGNTGTGDKGGAVAAGTAKAVKGPVGSAVVGGAGVSGGKVANASSVVARMKGRFRRCYQRGLSSNPEMAGSVQLVVRVGPNGEVQSVGGGGGGGLGAIVPCLKAVARSAAFSPPDGGSAVISIPITFVKQ